MFCEEKMTENNGNVSPFVQIFRGDTKIPRWLSPDAQDLLRRMLDPNPITRIDVAGIKAHDWFKQDYTPVIPIDDDDDDDDDDDLVPYSEPSSTKMVSNE